MNRRNFFGSIAAFAVISLLAEPTTYYHYTEWLQDGTRYGAYGSGSSPQAAKRAALAQKGMWS